MHFICTSLTEVRHFSSCLSQNILQVSKFSTSLVTVPARLTVTALHFPHDMWSLVKTTQFCSQGHYCRILVGFFVCFNQLHPTLCFPRILHICLTSPSWHTIKVGWSLFWSTISSRYLFNKWNKVVQCSEHGKRVKALFITNYRAVASWSGPAMATV